MHLTEEDKALLESNGWVVECERPLEARHTETGSFATWWAVGALVDQLKAEQETSVSGEEPMKVIDRLMCAVNAVTAPHRHGNEIPRRCLDKLANVQIDAERALEKLKEPVDD